MTELLSASGHTPLPDDHNILDSSTAPPVQHTSEIAVTPSRSSKVKNKGIASYRFVTELL